MRIGKSTWLAGLVVISLALAGCAGRAGQPAPKAGSAGPAPAPRAEQAAKPPLKIGILVPYSGVYSKLGESMTRAYELYFEEAGGKAGGRQIELVKEDEGDPQTGLRKVRKLVEQDQVDMITGIVRSDVLAAVRDAVHEAKKILIVANAGADVVTREKKSPYIFRVSFTNWQIAASQGEVAARLFGKKAVTLNPDYQAGKDNVKGFRDTYEKAGGKILKEIYFPLGNADFAPYLAQVKQLNPDVVYAFAAGSDAVRLVKQWKEYGLLGQIPIISNGFMVEEDVLAAVGADAVGHYSALSWAYSLDTPENKAFIEKFRKKYGVAPDVYAAQAYDAARLIVEAVNQVKGDTTNQAALMEALKKVTFRGPRGEFKLDPTTQNIILTMYIRQVQNVDGKPTNVVRETIKDWKDPGVTR